MALAAALLAGGLAACNGAAASSEGVLAPLCDAITADDAPAAVEAFEARVHAPLHALADEVATVDRGVAADLLEAKFAVEAVVRGDEQGPHPLITQRLQALQAQVASALQALDQPAPDC